ncbi:phage tail tube protein [Hansschlegelia sp.]|uniref:phage tail tube protein n=1 Tax=Hansschlegelia sp. TaxID=2041892 RepID=UPI002B6116C1|nr:phage tail tube protein [Hansschlegelia sp.]HVI28854.1 phage tail tube protein [Hansschlegelia sp.]
MALADHSSTRIAYVAETSFGVTPATPTFKTFRTTRAAGLRSNKTTVTSDEIRADRNVPDEPMVGLDVTGEYPVEMSYGSFDDILEGLLFGTWATNVLKNGVTRKSFTFEETRELGATDSFSRFPGVMVNQGQFTVNAREKIMATFSMMGESEELDDAIITGATYTAANAKPILTASANIAALAVAGLDPAPKVRSLGFTINNNLRVRPVVGALHSEEFGAGRCDVTGTSEMYFQSNELYQAVLDHGGGALSFVAGAATNEKYRFTFPKIIFLDGTVPTGGNTDDVMVSIPWRAVYDPTEGCSVKIERAVA